MTKDKIFKEPTQKELPIIKNTTVTKTKTSKNKQKNPVKKNTDVLIAKVSINEKKNYDKNVTDVPITKVTKNKRAKKKTYEPQKILGQIAEWVLETKVQILEDEIIALKAQVQKLTEKIDDNEAVKMQQKSQTIENIYSLTPNII